MEPEDVTWQRMAFQARLNLENDLRMIINAQRGSAGTIVGTAGQDVHVSPQSRLAGNEAIHYLPQNAFILESNQAGPVSAFQQPLAIRNGQHSMAIQGMRQGMTVPLSHESSQLLVITAANLSRLMNPVVTSASPIIILPHMALPLPGSGQQFTINQVAGVPHQQFVMPRGSFAHQQHVGQPIFLPGMSQVVAVDNSQDVPAIPEESKAALSSVRRQKKDVSLQLRTMGRNPLELLASASPFPNDIQANVPTRAATAPAYKPSIMQPSTSDAYRKEKSSNSENPKPKRPLSAYNIFFRDERAKIIAGELFDEEKAMLQKGCLFEDGHTSLGIKESRRKQPHRKAGFQELARIIAARWKRIDPFRLQTYEEMSARGRIKYSRDLQIWAQRERKDVMKPIQRLVERNMEKVAQGAREYR